LAKRVVGIVGSYRKGHIIDSGVSAVLEGARQAGAETTKIYLVDKHIEFCDNCRACTQKQKTEYNRGKCVHDDDMEEILSQIDKADAVVLGCPVNFFTVTAIMKRFVERLIVFAYWPWGAKAPKPRGKTGDKKAVIIASSACPAFIARLLMHNALSVLKAAANCLGAKVVKRLYFGTIAIDRDQQLGQKALKKAHQAGRKLT